MSHTRSAAALALLLIIGCKARDTNETKPTSQEAAPPKAPVAQPQPPAPGAPPPRGAVDVPTEEDFEEEASHKLTSKNLEEELDRLEKELEGK